MLREALLFALIIGAETSGELCITHAMKTIGEVKDFRPLSLIRVVARAVRVGWMWIGLALLAIQFFALLGMLSKENVSLVIPATALCYAVGALGGQVFLGERVNGQRWAGVVLVCIGVTLVFIGRG
jgi:drug/metabolite transporter (DMT)-like permease